MVQTLIPLIINTNQKMQQLWSEICHNTVAKYHAAISTTAITHQHEYNMAPGRSQYICTCNTNTYLYKYTKHSETADFRPQFPSVLAVTFALCGKTDRLIQSHVTAIANYI